MKKTKEAVSLIVLVLTIVIMIILSGVVVISLNNSGMIDRARTSVDDANFDQVKEMANVAWGEAYLQATEEQRDDAAYLKREMIAKLILKGVEDPEAKYVFDVTTGGVEVSIKPTTTPQTPTATSQD